MGFRAFPHTHGQYVTDLTWNPDDIEFDEDDVTEVPRHKVPLTMRHNAYENARFEDEERIKDAFSKIGKLIKRPFERFQSRSNDHGSIVRYDHEIEMIEMN